MSGIIDIHAHVIPHVDDGSHKTETSLTMLKESVNQGVESLICTPHFRKPFCISPEETIDAFNKFKERVKEANIPINLYLGQEIYCKEDFKEQIENKNVLTLNNTKFILLEFDFTKTCDVVDAVYEVESMGYIPVVAHLERYEYLTCDDAYEIKKNGGFIQINAESIVGKPGSKVKKFVKNLFKEGFVDFVASDIHHGRDNKILEAYKYVNKKYGEDAAEVVFKENAKRIIKG